MTYNPLSKRITLYSRVLYHIPYRINLKNFQLINLAVDTIDIRTASANKNRKTNYDNDPSLLLIVCACVV